MIVDFKMFIQIYEFLKKIPNLSVGKYQEKEKYPLPHYLWENGYIYKDPFRHIWPLPAFSLSTCPIQ
jgi:hypothetical protein